MYVVTRTDEKRRRGTDRFCSRIRCDRSLQTYSPALGRFLQADPIGYDGDGPNLYAYVLNDPVNFVDPLGLSWVKACVGVDKGEMNCGWHWIEPPERGGGSLGTGNSSGPSEPTDSKDQDQTTCPPPNSRFATREDAGLAGAQWERANAKRDERSFSINAVDGGFTFNHGFEGDPSWVPIPLGTAGDGHLHMTGGGSRLSTQADQNDSLKTYDVENITNGLNKLQRIGVNIDGYLTVLGGEDGNVYAWYGTKLKGPGKRLGPDTCN